MLVFSCQSCKNVNIKEPLLSSLWSSGSLSLIDYSVNKRNTRIIYRGCCDICSSVLMMVFVWYLRTNQLWNVINPFRIETMGIFCSRLSLRRKRDVKFCCVCLMFTDWTFTSTFDEIFPLSSWSRSAPINSTSWVRSNASKPPSHEGGRRLDESDPSFPVRQTCQQLPDSEHNNKRLQMWLTNKTENLISEREEKVMSHLVDVHTHTQDVCFHVMLCPVASVPNTRLDGTFTRVHATNLFVFISQNLKQHRCRPLFHQLHQLIHQLQHPLGLIQLQHPLRTTVSHHFSSPGCSVGWCVFGWVRLTLGGSCLLQVVLGYQESQLRSSVWPFWCLCFLCFSTIVRFVHLFA